MLGYGTNHTVTTSHLYVNNSNFFAVIMIWHRTTLCLSFSDVFEVSIKLWKPTSFLWKWRQRWGPKWGMFVERIDFLFVANCTGHGKSLRKTKSAMGHYCTCAVPLSWCIAGSDLLSCRLTFRKLVGRVLVCSTNCMFRKGARINSTCGVSNYYYIDKPILGFYVFINSYCLSTMSRNTWRLKESFIAIS